jgi:phage repressor protein C with HTH and peptisase S24 domain
VEAEEPAVVKRKLRSDTPKWASKIEAFRHSLELSQQEFGNRLGTTAMSISRWERGEAQPPADAYIRMGNIAGDPMCWYFWEQAGLSIADVKRVLPSVEQRRVKYNSVHGHVVHAGVRKGGPVAEAEFVTVPLLPISVATPGERGDKEADLAMSAPESLLAAPAAWCPHPLATFCLRVKGNSMAPLILDGYIIAVDSEDIQRDHLVGEIVVARHVEQGLLVSRLIRFDHSDVLVSDRREFDSVLISKESDWKLVGRVLWWTGLARSN